MANQEGKITKKKRGVGSYHQLYKRKGVYRFFYKNALKVAIFIGLIAAGIFLLKELMPDYDQQLELLLSRFNPALVIILFFVSESFLGLIPPDFFIIWTQNFDQPYFWVSFLAVLSYLGGIVAYFIGKYVGLMPAVERWLIKNFLRHLDLIKKWGGVLIVFAALFPLPFSAVCILAGIIRFPIKTFFGLALFRFLRFYFYAVILFSIV